jgi:DHA1 family bicyclomycin/chloramphenicol resistance-like MFS transporter
VPAAAQQPTPAMSLPSLPDHATTPKPLAPSQRRQVILILGALFTVTPFSIDMYLPAYQQIAHALNCSNAQISLSLASYFVGMALGQLFYGPLLDHYGRKPPIYVGLGVYILASLACVEAPSVQILVALRFLQALGGCVAQVATVAMVRDFFPAADSARIFSMLLLILGVSPLLAPTFGSLIATSLGWPWVFFLLAAIAAVILAITAVLLPVGYQADLTVVLRPKQIIATFATIFAEPRFRTNALAGACSFSGLFVYVAGSPIIFMENFHVGARTYGVIFAILSVGFIGGSNLNILVSRHVSSERIFATALTGQLLIGLVFACGAAQGWYGLVPTIALLFALLACLGFTNPNATALALSPINHNLGSASALLGFLQVGISATASAAVGLLDAHTVAPIIAVVTVMAAIGMAILLLGQRRRAVAIS